MDLPKAFDTVPHDILLDVLNAYGMRGVALGVFGSYLNNTTETLTLGDITSDPQIVKLGVRQGTVLGPILFIIYIKSLTNMNVQNGTVISYADSTAVVFHGKTWSEGEDFSKIGTGSVKNWLDTLKLILNITKTKYVFFSLTSVNRPSFQGLKIDNIEECIEEVSQIKYLDIIIDRNLK